MLEQGLYRTDTTIYYITNLRSKPMYRKLKIGTKISGYNHMFEVPPSTIPQLVPLVLGWLPNDAVPSDLYPELFI